MTMTTRHGTRRDTFESPQPAAVVSLRQIVRLDVALCAASGTALLTAARPLADLAGLDGTGPTLVVGAFLVALAAGLGLLVRASTETLVRLVPWSAVGDLVWAAASVAVAVSVSMNGIGQALVLVQGVVVAAVGVLKLVAHRSARAAIIGVR